MEPLCIIYTYTCKEILVQEPDKIVFDLHVQSHDFSYLFSTSFHFRGEYVLSYVLAVLAEYSMCYQPGSILIPPPSI